MPKDRSCPIRESALQKGDSVRVFPISPVFSDSTSMGRICTANEEKLRPPWVWPPPLGGIGMGGRL